MLFIAIGILFVIFPACREIHPATDQQSITGYQINGVVTSPNGIPIDSVEVILSYYYSFIDTKPLDTIAVVITDTFQTLDISVYTLKKRYVTTIYFGVAKKIGTVSRATWNGRDWENKPMPSGMYLIRYGIDSLIIKYSPYVIDGRVTAITDINGRFVISDENLPIGRMFDAYKYDTSFCCVYKIAPKIALEFRKREKRAVYESIDLIKDKITTRTFAL